MNRQRKLIRRGQICVVALVTQAAALAILDAEEPADFAPGVQRSARATPQNATGRQECLPHSSPSPNHSAIPWSEIGAKAGADYHGNGLSVRADTHGARLRCDFQKLKGEVTSEGLWLVSTSAP
jgi:hypothetical protein